MQNSSSPTMTPTPRWSCRLSLFNMTLSCYCHHLWLILEYFFLRTKQFSFAASPPHTDPGTLLPSGGAIVSDSCLLRQSRHCRSHSCGAFLMTVFTMQLTEFWHLAPHSQTSSLIKCDRPPTTSQREFLSQATSYCLCAVCIWVGLLDFSG